MDDNTVPGTRLREDVGQLRVWCDGACVPNPGQAGIGISIVDANGLEVHSISESIGHGTNNIAEHESLRAALRWLHAHGYHGAHIFMDSELVVKQVLGHYSCDQANLRVLRNESANLLARVHASLQWIPREQNGRADELSHRGLFNTLALTPAMREAAAALLERMDFGLPAIPENVRHILTLVATGAQVDAIAEAALMLHSGRDAFSSLHDAALRDAAEVRQGAAGIAEIDTALSERSQRTRDNAYRWASRGMLPRLAIYKVDIDKAARTPYVRRSGG